MHKKREWIWLFAVVMGVILLFSSSNNKIVMAQEEQSTLITDSAPELSSWEEPQRSLEELLDLEKSRVAATGVNRRAPFYVAFQLKSECSDWVVTALNYQSAIQPSENFLVDMNMQQTGLYIGERVTTDEMMAGQWNLQEVWVMSPRRVVLCITRASQEEIFSRFDFSLVENETREETETGTEQGSLVERPELGSDPSVNSTAATDPLPVATDSLPVTAETQPIVPESASAASQIPESAPVASQVPEPAPSINNVPAPEQTLPVEEPAVEQNQVAVAVLEHSEDSILAQALPSSELEKETQQSKTETEKETNEQITEEESEQESLENTETESNNQSGWSFFVLVVIFAGAGIVLIYIQNRKQ